MDKFLRPSRFDCSVDDPTAPSQWIHWRKTFENFLAQFPADPPIDRLLLLTNFVAPSVYEFVADIFDFEEAIQTLATIFIKPKNVIFARHALHSRIQAPGENFSQYYNALKFLSRDCNFQAVTAAQHQEECIRDAFVSGIFSTTIRQRLLERENLPLPEALDSALALEAAQKNVSAVKTSVHDAGRLKCFFCGGSEHPRTNCPAKQATCHHCGKVGHFAKFPVRRAPLIEDPLIHRTPNLILLQPQ